jgi:S-adenosylmethionine hydrolase
MGNSRIITLITDFGLKDHYVAAMKGVMLGLNPDLVFVDISHLIPSQDILTAAFTLGQAAACFPPGTIHLAVVDPGVGTERRAIIASVEGHYFVAPDNGVLSYVYNAAAEFTVHEITADHYFRKPISSTFHGRDIFAPVAAWLSRDIAPPQFGAAVANPIRLKIPEPLKLRDTMIEAAVLAADQFGNLVTNLKPGDVPIYGGTAIHTAKLLAGKREITSFRMTFAEGKPGELFVVPGSSGYLEVVVREGSAASELGLKPGDPIGVIIS